MHYVISDIHGCYSQYLEMLEKIKFSSDDILYINGDVIDRGPKPVEILKHMMNHDNIIPIMGNHEFAALKVLQEVVHDRVASLSDRSLWYFLDNQNTVYGLSRLDSDERKLIVDYMASFPFYKEVIVNDTDYVITHAGIDYEFFDPSTLPDKVNWKACTWAETDYDRIYYPDKILVTGHTPVDLIRTDAGSRIIKQNNHIATDCGCCFGGSLACICLETEEEFYVPGINKKT